MLQNSHSPWWHTEMQVTQEVEGQPITPCGFLIKEHHMSNVLINGEGVLQAATYNGGICYNAL